MSSSDWATTLDVFEQRLAAQWSALEQGALEPVAPFEPPTVVEPLPQDFVDRAADLVRRCRALEDALAAALAKVTDQLDRAAEPATGPPAEPVYFDSRV